MVHGSELVTAVIVVLVSEAMARRWGEASSGALGAPPRGWVVASALMVFAALVVRGWSIQSIHGVGNEFVAIARSVHGLSGSSRRVDLADLLHAPLHQHLLGWWIRIIDALGWPPQARWIRLPNVVLTGLLVLALARLGRALRAPWAGLGASAIYLASPMLLQLHNNQENYLLEALGGAIFAERLATWGVAGIPAYRSLAVAAAFAFAAGYMNAPLLGAGVLAAPMVFWRRRDGRGFVLSLGWTLALVGRLALGLLTATLALRAVSQDTRTSSHLMHATMPMTMAFGEGSASLLGQRLLDAIGGPAGTWLAVASVGVMVLRPAAWVGVAALGGTFVAGLVLPFNIQNYALAALVLIFLGCWGFEEFITGLCGLLGRRFGLRGPTVAGLAGLAVAVFASAAAFTAFHRWPLRQPHNHFLPYRDITPLRHALEAPPRTPLLVLAQRIPDPEFVELCRAVRSTRAMVACVDRVRRPNDEAAWTLAEVEGRRLAAPTEQLTSPGVPRPLREELQAMVARPPWSEGFLLWVGDEQGRCSPFVSEALEALVARCPVVASAAFNTLRRCPSR